MAEPGITLNIYNKPPKFDDVDNNNNDNNNGGNNVNDNNNNNDNINEINQTAADINQTLNLPTRSKVENIRMDATSAPRANYEYDNTRNNNRVEPPINYQRNIQPNPIQQYPQQMMTYPQRPIYVTPVATPMVQPYNMQYPRYAQPIIIRQPNVNTQRPKTVIVKKQKRDNSGDCCAGLLGGCCAALTACCLLSMCCGGGRGYRRGRW